MLGLAAQHALSAGLSAAAPAAKGPRTPCAERPRLGCGPEGCSASLVLAGDDCTSQLPSHAPQPHQRPRQAKPNTQRPHTAPRRWHRPDRRSTRPNTQRPHRYSPKQAVRARLGQHVVERKSSNKARPQLARTYTTVWKQKASGQHGQPSMLPKRPAGFQNAQPASHRPLTRPNRRTQAEKAQ